METLLPPTVRQARWFIVGGLVAAVMGVVRIVGFVNYGGLVALVMGTVFLGLALASLAAGIIRIRRGDDPGRPSGPTRT
ncbi:hypothetical protein [Mycolicibacterium gilvum]|uniref:Transmembrane protein n=1 Tax=Mycolicibacterium gilvum TaxID=1804 RepID=A0A378SI46_9MYCO|nr:hypothetical protein [Mycolicibacterium gilvum]MCV7055056.1 hypothetical protein [Mycolicibacterium gilvum]STZ42370.1 Uncharacterised protein [Mycolicibacterium gilvum]